MRFSRYPTTATEGDEISFPILECWNPMTEVATIAAEVNKRRVSCRVSLAVLQERFHASPEEPMRAVAENRSTLRAAARRLIEKQAFEEDGSIVIQNTDIRLPEDNLDKLGAS